MQQGVVGVIEVNEHEHQRSEPSCEIGRLIATYSALRTDYPEATLVVFWWNCDAGYTRYDTKDEDIQVFFF
jgi:hypothetical protein